MTPAGTSNELDVQNEWEENTHTVKKVCFLKKIRIHLDLPLFIVVSFILDVRLHLFGQYVDAPNGGSHRRMATQEYFLEYIRGCFEVDTDAAADSIARDLTRVLNHQRYAGPTYIILCQQCNGVLCIPSVSQVSLSRGGHVLNVFEQQLVFMFFLLQLLSTSSAGRCTKCVPRTWTRLYSLIFCLFSVCRRRATKRDSRDVEPLTHL